MWIGLGKSMVKKGTKISPKCWVYVGDSSCSFCFLEIVGKNGG